MSLDSTAAETSHAVAPSSTATEMRKTEYQPKRATFQNETKQQKVEERYDAKHESTS